MYVVTGATGNTGAVVAGRLLDAGKKVRVFVRTPEKAASLAKKGAEVAVGDLSEERGLESTFAGAEGLYLLSPPDITTKSFVAERKALTGTIARVIGRARVKHVALLSSIAAHLPSGTGPIVTLHDAEEQLRATGVPTTFVRATYFIENWAPSLAAAKKDGVLPTFLPATMKLPMVAARDVGAAAADALLAGPRGVRVIELAGPAELSATDVANAAGKILGRPVKVVEAPLDAVVPTLTSYGFSENVAALFREMLAGFASGKVTWDGRGERVRGKTTLEDAIRPLL